MRAVVNKLGEMVTADEFIFSRAWDVCAGLTVVDEARGLLKGQDKEVNRLEREVRRRVLEHLGINPGQDAPGCLAVMIMAKDLERIGDHGRAVFELVAKSGASVSGMKLFGRMDAISRKLRDFFPELRQAILESSEAVAHDILDQYLQIKDELKDLHGALFTSEMTSQEAILAALLSRSLARINAHVGNVASGVIFPLENIDFVSRGLREEAASGVKTARTAP